MLGEAAESAVELPILAYVDPIRSVLFVDDQFPTYAEPDSGDEKDRARALWTACRDRGWLCDVDNASDWTTREQCRRLASCDLLVLDYHLSAGDPTPALRVIEQLASSPSPNLVVVYTADTGLDAVLLHLAAHARGVSKDLCTGDLSDDVANLQEKIDWSQDALIAHIAGKDGWRRDFVTEWRNAGVAGDPDVEGGRALVERELKKTYGAPLIAETRSVQAIHAKDDKRWFQCGNLFVAVVGKPRQDSGGADDATMLLTGLENAIRDWNPSWLACLIARSRHESNEGAFRDDLHLPNDSLQKGLIGYVTSATEQEERLRRSRHVASDLLHRRIDAAISSMGDRLLEAVSSAAAKAPHELDTNTLLHVNAFLCSQRHDRHHLRTGTVFRSEDGEQFWVCVTPACDMVPRARKESVDPWGASLGDTRAMTVIQLDMSVKNETAIGSAEQGRYIFFDDYSSDKPMPRAAAVFNTSTNDPNPRVEQVFARNLARVKDGTVSMQRVILDGQGDLSLQEQRCIVVCQLRAPYAERLTHIVGGHVSRIGVDFLSKRKRDKKRETE
ncbi:MAG: hypothetical protein AMXMBFR64_43070 [Myxococcales bacterium]